MTSPSSKKSRLFSPLRAAGPVILSIVGLGLTAISLSPAQVSQNLEDVIGIAIPLYLLMSTAGVIVLLVLNRRIRRQQMDAPSNTLVRASRDRSDAYRLEELNRALASATTIDAIGIANNVLTSEQGAGFYRDFLIRRKGQARLLFLAPGRDSIRAREVAELRSEGALSMFVHHNLEDVRRFVADCAEENPKIAQQVKVRLYDFAPALNAIIVDNTVAFVHYYGTNTRGYDAPTFTISQKSPALLSFYIAEFESLWKLGTDWDPLVSVVPSGKGGTK